MPFPSEALTITGGCNCRNVRYRLSIARLEDRPFHPNFDSTSKLSPVYQPYIFTDHCNDCRRATGSILPAWISGPLEYIEISLKQDGDDDHDHYLPGPSILTGPTSKTQGKLSFYNSSPGRYRTFCTTCGTNLTFWESQIPSMFDVALGTVDREHLENLAPERHLWWDRPLPWIRDYLDKGDGGHVDRHVEAQMNNRYPLPKDSS